MSSNKIPDYELEDVRVVSSPQELRAMGHRVRSTILDLVLDRAATVSELATAIGRPPSTVAYHVGVLVDADMLKVVRTRKVRAIDERFYGRTARIFSVGAIEPEQAGELTNLLAVAARDSKNAHEADELRALVRRARIPRRSAAEFWERVFELTHEFDQKARSGDTVYAFVAGLYPTDYPALPDRNDEESP
ncbi:MAG TPA: helix-turn-helix domain-containing protein [Acidimicrobiia bacterium]|nr:helix-turn-helix domain-containing protein [Acidimicrobiia bacterium]